MTKANDQIIAIYESKRLNITEEPFFVCGFFIEYLK
jgi:hypothetical protein